MQTAHRVLRGATEGSDFSCSSFFKLYRCRPKNAATLETFKKLQKLVRTIAQTMSRVGVLNVPSDLSTLSVDGDIGPTTAIGVQFVAAAFAAVAPPPDAVAVLLLPTTTSADLIKAIATNATEIVAYFEATSANPEAFRTKPVIEVRPPPASWLKKVAGVVVAGGLLTTIAVIYARETDQS
jgi:hypothetical protein